MAYWEEYPYKVVTHFPLSSDIISIMYTEDDIHKRLGLNKDPVELSISKWERIFQVYNIISGMKYPFAHYQDIYPFIGHTTCALCIVSVRNYKQIFGSQKFREDKCYMCPFSNIERFIDKTSTYTEIDRILWNSFNYGDDLSRIDYYSDKHKTLGELITRFIDLLKQIR
jgi:hypothetical protein